MFEKLVVSTNQRRSRATGKFFAGTALLYVCAIAGALVVSILVSDPKLADTTVISIISPVSLIAGTTPKQAGPPPKIKAPLSDPDPRHPMTLDDIMRSRNSAPPRLALEHLSAQLSSGPSDGPPGSGSRIGVPQGDETIEAPPAPDPPKPKPAVQQTPVVDNKPMRLTSVVLQGKAIERRIPVYPRLAVQIGLRDSVAVEVVISPEGRVESARSISGHPMLRPAAEEAARGWRFGPTLLNGVPVRVTGVITFVFKLND